jgi:hypothetical protein
LVNALIRLYLAIKFAVLAPFSFMDY